MLDSGTMLISIRRAQVWWTAALTIVTTISLAGCGAGGRAATTTQIASSRVSTPAEAATSSATLPCLSDSAQGLPSPAPTGAVAGTGSTAVVFVNTADGSACDWAEFAKGLVRDGHQVALYDYRSAGGPLTDRTSELRSVVAAVRKAGATEVVVIGGSRGGCLGLIEAATNPGISAVVVLSCARVWNQSDPTSLAPYLAKIRQPVLSIVAAHDPDVPAAWVAADQKLMGSTATSVVIQGSSHGSALLTQPGVAEKVRGFVRAH